MNSIHPAVRLALGMTVLIILGLVASFIAMGVCGSEDWHVWAMVVRYAWPALFSIPILWMLAANRLETNQENGWSERTTLRSGLLVVAGLLLLFTLTVCSPASSTIIHPARILSGD